MFEAKLTEGVILKKIVESIKDIVTDVNIDISPSGKSAILLFSKPIRHAITEIYRNFSPSNGQLSCGTCLTQS